MMPNGKALIAVGTQKPDGGEEARGKGIVLQRLIKIYYVLGTRAEKRGKADEPH